MLKNNHASRWANSTQLELILFIRVGKKVFAKASGYSTTASAPLFNMHLVVDDTHYVFAPYYSVAVFEPDNFGGLHGLFVAGEMQVEADMTADNPAEFEKAIGWYEVSPKHWFYSFVYGEGDDEDDDEDSPDEDSPDGAFSGE